MLVTEAEPASATGWQRIRALRRPLCCRLRVKDSCGSTTGKASLSAQPSDASRV